jgi:hypothetical protein
MNKNTSIVMIHDFDDQHHTLIKRETLSDEYVFEKILESEAWPDGLEVYVKNA